MIILGLPVARTVRRTVSPWRGTPVGPRPDTPALIGTDRTGLEACGGAAASFIRGEGCSL